MIEKNGWYVCERKEYTVDEEFHCNVLLKIPSEAKEAVVKEAEWSGDE